MGNWALLLIIGLMGMAGAIVLFIVGLRWKPADETKTRLPEKTAAPASPPAPAPIKTYWTMAGGAIAAFLGNLSNARDSAALQQAPEIMRLRRDVLTGRLIIELDGRRYAKAEELLEPRLQESLLAILSELENFARPLMTKCQDAPEAPALASMVVAPKPPAVVSPPPSSTPASPSTTDSSQPPPLRLPSMDPFKQMRVLRELEKNIPPKPKTIVEQIDEILQAKIEATVYSQRGMRVCAGPRGDAVFELDGLVYETADEVPETAARELFRAVIREWETR